MDRPRFSIIIPLYNKKNTIERTINSVKQQSYKDYELVIVDDGSSDGSRQFAEQKLPRSGRCIVKKNGGVSSARNTGAFQSKGEWILFLDADDELTSESLTLFADAVERNPRAKVFIGGEIYNSKKKSVQGYKLYKTPLFQFWLNILHPRPGALLVHRTVFSQSKGFDERVSFYEDTEFAERILAVHSVVSFLEPTVIYHQEAGGLSGSSHPIEKEMAYYIPEYVETVSFWHKALLYENLEMEILWWQQHGNDENVRFYQDMQKKYFGRIYKVLHWIRQKLIRYGVI